MKDQMLKHIKDQIEKAKYAQEVAHTDLKNFQDKHDDTKKKLQQALAEEVEYEQLKKLVEEKF